MAASSAASSLTADSDAINDGHTPTPISGSLSTNAVTRNFSDLHAPTWFGLLSANIAARTLLFHPIQLAISRKRLTRESTAPTVWGLMKAAYRGGKTSAYGVTCTTGQYNFGQGGVRGLYRGVGTALLCNLAGETSYLFTLEAMKEYVARSKPRQSDADGQHEGSSVGSSSTTGAQCFNEEASSTFVASSSSAAVGAMCGDLVALLLVSPLVIVCNRQMTAGYSMASTNRYMNISCTLIEVWSLYQQDPTSVSQAARTSTVASDVVKPPLTTSAVRHLSRVRRGFSGLYQGLSAGLLRIPSSGCWWGLYTKSKEAIYTVASPTLSQWEQEYLEKTASGTTGAAIELHENGVVATTRASFWQQNWFLSPTDNPLLNALAGVFASVCTTLIFNPISVIQTRQQSLPPHFWMEASTHRARGSSSDDAVRAYQRAWKTSLPFRRVYHVANDLVRQEGFRGFFKGAPANISVAVMDGVIFTLLFEFTKLGSDMQFLEQRNTDSVA